MAIPWGDVSTAVRTGWGTLARCVWILLLALAISVMRLVKASLTLLNWRHISSAVPMRRLSVLARSLAEAARALCERKMLLSVNLAHVSGTETLQGEHSLSKVTLLSLGAD